MNQEEIQNCVLYVTTSQGSAFRTITETLKECISDTVINFDQNGLHITDCNNKRGIVTKLTLDNFDVLHCTKSDDIALDMLTFHKLLKTVSNKDVLTLYIDKKDTERLGIMIQNKEKNTVSNIKMNLKNLDNDNLYTIPDMQFDHTFYIPCSEFQKILRDLCIIDPNLSFFIDSQEVEVENEMTHEITTKIMDSLVLHVHGQIGEQITKIDTNTSGVNPDNGNPEKINNKSSANIKLEDIKDHFIGMFNLETLNIFFKASSICSKVELYLKAGAPLLISFKIANIGTLKFILSPLNNRIIPKA